MLKECRKALRIKTEAFDDELCLLMRAGAEDLKIAGVNIPGTVTFTATVTTAGESISDNSSLKDPLVMRAIFTYAHVLFYKDESLRESYETQKTQLMHANDYTDYESGGDCE